MQFYVAYAHSREIGYDSREAKTMEDAQAWLAYRLQHHEPGDRMQYMVVLIHSEDLHPPCTLQSGIMERV